MMLQHLLVVVGLLLFPASSKRVHNTFTGTYQLTKVTNQTDQPVPLPHPDQYLLTIERCTFGDDSFCLYLKILNMYRATTAKQAGGPKPIPVEFIGNTRIGTRDPKLRALEIQIFSIFDATPLPKVLINRKHNLIIRSNVGRMVFNRTNSSSL